MIAGNDANASGPNHALARIIATQDLRLAAVRTRKFKTNAPAAWRIWFPAAAMVRHWGM